ncbi:hypothetical protein P7C73_g4348, partial [Tremellales sp. Uapishka_1]
GWRGKEEVESRIKALQAEVWRAKGEVATVRAAQKDDHVKRQAEVEKYKGKVAALEADLLAAVRDKEKGIDAARTSATFKTHQLLNSARKEHRSSQKPGAGPSSQHGRTPFRNGTPARRESTLMESTPAPLQALKGKGVSGPFRAVLTRSSVGKALPPPPPVFAAFQNGFHQTPIMGRNKRAKTEIASPTASPSKNRLPTPINSPTRSLVSPTKSLKGSPRSMRGDEGMEVDGEMEDWAEEEGNEHEPDLRSELLHQLFSHIPSSPSQIALGLTTQPTIYRIMKYQPSTEYTMRCSDILRACGDSDRSFEDLLEVVATNLGALFIEQCQQVETDPIPLINIVDLLSSLLFSFPFPQHVDPDWGRYLKTTVEKEWVRESLELVSLLVDLAEGLVWFGDGRKFWRGEELVDVILCLTAPTSPFEIVKRGIDLFSIATCHSQNFRTLMSTSVVHKTQNSLPPIIDALSRHLLTRHSGCSQRQYTETSIAIIHGFSMLSVSDSDGPTLLGDQGSLVPSLIMILERESRKICGVSLELHDMKETLSILIPTLTLLHHLVFPAPMHGKQATGMNLPARLQSSAHPFNGLQHVFVAAMGKLAYTEVDEEDGIPPADWRSITYLSQDLLEAVVEGPEGDSIYEIYVGEEDPPDQVEEEDEEVYEEMNMGNEDMDED